MGLAVFINTVAKVFGINVEQTISIYRTSK